MHPSEEGTHLDAIYFSPHKFLGGPGSNGVLIFNSSLYKKSGARPSGWRYCRLDQSMGEHKYHEEIEAREDGGTPGFCKPSDCPGYQAQRKMGVDNIKAREQEILDLVWNQFAQMPKVHVFADHQKIGCQYFHLSLMMFTLQFCRKIAE